MKAFVVEKDYSGKIVSGIKDVPRPKCEDNEILIKVEYSSLNYKDALSSIGHSGVTRNFPHITGVDVAGIVEESKSSIFKIGQRVIVTGYDLGMNTDGGHAEFVKVPASWAIRTPDSISNRDIMAYGTAGLTAALSVEELRKNGLNPENSKILVSGSTGGAGSICVAILNKLGFEVTALTTKNDKEEYLKSIGAKDVMLIDDFLQNSSKPLLSTKFDGFIDTVGGDILAQGLKQLKYDGVATCCGLTASSDLNINVFPFILRGVRLIGIDSVECSLEKKQQAWNNLSGIFAVTCMNKIIHQVKLDEIKEIYTKMLEAKIFGRYIVNIA